MHEGSREEGRTRHDQHGCFGGRCFFTWVPLLPAGAAAGFSGEPPETGAGAAPAAGSPASVKDLRRGMLELETRCVAAETAAAVAEPAVAAPQATADDRLATMSTAPAALAVAA